MAEQKAGRRYDLDWLRVLLIFMVFVFHSGRAFDAGDWHVNNATLSPAIREALRFMTMWMLPTIFVISGASIWYSLGVQKPLRFIKAKITRLFVPLIVGAFVLAPHQVYLERLTRGEFSGSFFAWFPRYFDGLYGFGGNFAFHGMHLWYLFFLFFFTLLQLPVYLFLRSEKGRPLIRAAGAVLGIPGMIYLLGLILIVPVAYIDDQSILGTRMFAGWTPVYYFIILFFGFLIFADERIQKAIIRVRYVSIVLGVVLFAALRLGFTFGRSPLRLVMYHFGLSSWCFITAILGFGMKHLTRTNRFLSYAGQAVLPFYMLHQPVILLVAYGVVQLTLPIAAKVLLIALLSFTGIMLLYEGIRRVNVLRFLFGMKVRRAADATGGTSR